MILYGPPGTGKTYHTVNYAVAIIENKFLDEVLAEDYSAVKDRFNQYKEDGLIEFTTFHQSYGYEEFIEGIKPVFSTDGEETTDISYEIADGVFKKICDRASMPVISKSNDFGFSEYSTVWKVSLAGTGDNPVRRDCMKNNYIRIGWDEYSETITDETDFSKAGGKNALNAFINRMQIGDIVLSCYSERTIDAVGVIEGDYEWRPELKDYCRVRKVKWIVKGINYDIYELNNNNVMTLSTVYRLNNISVSDVIEILKQTSSQIVSSDAPKNYVFIIDEINRGNISKIFGELLTLIEPSKRVGQREELKVRLPYSQRLFGVPDNVYIIGTMNTADRSIALIDTALRRRFNFVEMQPDIEILEGIEI
ncbi:MAG TPA: AAA domain-containing protein, partial [Clostridia bacterium]|nr:AAA domain-containing protein [Clostridia bacterium]